MTTETRLTTFSAGRWLGGLALAVLPWSLAQACDENCLNETAKAYMAALEAQDETQVNWAERVYFTEDQVSMMIGDALWGAVRRVSPTPQIFTDEQSRNVALVGWVEEHDAPAYYAMRLQVDSEGRVEEVETIVARKEEPGLFHEDVHGKATLDALDGELTESARSSRERMQDIAHGFYSSLQQNDGTLFTDFSDDCYWQENGQDVAASAEGLGVSDCQSLLSLGYFAPLERVRDRQFPVIDEARGVVLAISTRDQANDQASWQTNDGQRHEVEEWTYYPHSRGTMDLLKIENGRITAIHTTSNFLPYFMPSPWQERKLGRDGHSTVPRR